MRDLKKYDKYLRLKSLLNGTKRIFRISPYNTQIDYDVVLIQNEYIGSGLGVLRDIMLRDSQRFDIAGRVLESNRKLLDKERSRDKRMSQEVANMMMCDNIII